LLLGVIVLTLASVGLVWALATNGWSLNRVLNTCVGQDEEELADLRQVAAETLYDVDNRSSEYSGCEDVGKAGEAAAVADVLIWREFSAAKGYFVAEGWIKQESWIFHSPDGEHSARVSMLKEEGAPIHASIYFMHTD
jgi:hypothetical protein